jgi:hypothetical protein
MSECLKNHLSDLSQRFPVGLEYDRPFPKRGGRHPLGDPRRTDQMGILDLIKVREQR